MTPSRAGKEKTPKYRIPTIEKTRKAKTHPQNNCPLLLQCVALAGVSSGAAVKGLISVQWCLRANRRRSPHSAALELQACLRAQRRDSRAVVLVMMEEEVARRAL
jgi:hypothetical protein